MGGCRLSLALVGVAALWGCSHPGTPGDFEAGAGPPVGAPAGEFIALPAGPSRTSLDGDTHFHVFDVFDVVASQGATMSGQTFALQGEGFSYVVVGVKTGGFKPDKVSMWGTMTGLRLAVADYRRGCWQWLGGPYGGASHAEGLEVQVTASAALGPQSGFFLALVCPEGASADLSWVDVKVAPDTDPPQWLGTPGVAWVGSGHLHVKLGWSEAFDAVSPPVTYLIYCAPSASGIDLSSPAKEVSGTTSSWVLGLENGTSYDIAVRARDAVGNTTTIGTVMRATPSDEGRMLELPIEPGDKIELSWTNPAANVDLMMMDQNARIASPRDPVEMQDTFGFSEDSLTSGLPYESAELLPTAPTMLYTLSLFNDYLSPPGQELVSVRVLDSSGALKYDLSQYPVDAGLDMWYVDLRFFDPTRLVHADWQPGDRLEATWGDVDDSIMLTVRAPDGRIDPSMWGEDPTGWFAFYEPPYPPVTPLDWAKLLPIAPAGDYLISIDYIIYGPIPAPIEVKLYDSVGTLKQDLGTCNADDQLGFEDYALLHCD